MKTLNVLLIMPFLAAQALCGDLNFVQESRNNPSAEAMALDLAKVYKLTYEEKDHVSAELSGYNFRSPFQTQGIQMPDGYKGKIRFNGSLPNRETMMIDAGVSLLKAMEPIISLDTEYRMENKISIKAGYSLKASSKMRMGLGFKAGSVQFEYMFLKDQDMHKLGFVTRLG